MADPVKIIARLEKKLARSESHRVELEHLRDVSHNIQQRVKEEIEQANREIEEKNEKLETLNGALAAEQKLTDRLMLSIMPEKIAAELKVHGHVVPLRHDDATIMFTDFVNFTKSTESLDPVVLVRTLDVYVRQMDEIVARHNVVKLKTIGDAYMCVSGVPEPDVNQIGNVIGAARDILKLIKEMRENPPDNCEVTWDIRIGIHSGPVSAGVIGSDRLTYDIWGDTVNTAARLVDAAATNAVLVSNDTYIKSETSGLFDAFPAIEAKGKGLIKVWQLRA